MDKIFLLEAIVNHKIVAEAKLTPSEIERAKNDWNALKLAYSLPDCAIDNLLKKLESIK